MPSETIVAVFETSVQAERAAQALVAAGVPEDAIERHSNQSESAKQSRRESGPKGGTGFFFWDMMFGMPSGHQDRSEYERSIERGETVLAVTVAEPDADAVMSILERESPLDVDERGKQAPARAEASQRQRTAEHEQREEEREEAPAKRAPESRRESEQAVEGEEEVIPLAEESLEVGKRTVNRGTTRIRRYVVESPVEKTVPLRDERVTLERRQPTTDKVTGDALTEKTVEVTETSEVPETEKVARLKEEVVVRREAVDREEQVRDTVRRDEIAVEDASEAQRESPRRKKAG